jgi:2-polyprenyl-3-methyl-5-hydroxy-6-metoxy-1,4-benzoquinol methylase
LAYFDHFATARSTRLGDWLTARTIEQEFGFISRFLPTSQTIDILEIGPGHGELAERFMRAGYRGYDIVEPNDLLRAKLQSTGVRVAKSYMIPDLAESDASYDLIIVCDVFEHLNDAREAQRFITEANRVLRPGGTIFILSPDLMDWKEDFYNCDFSHSNPTTVRRTRELLSNVGLETVAFTYSYSCFGGVLGYLLSRAVKLATFWTLGESVDYKSYKLRLTFLRRFALVGRKGGAA